MTGLALVLIGAFSAFSAILVYSRGAAGPLAQQPGPSPSPAETIVLTPGAVIPEQRIESGQKHFYELTLDQGQFARISVDQRAVDLKLTVTGPESFSFWIDSPNGFFGPETVSLLAPSNGTYRIEVALSSPGQYPPGIYDLRVDGPRPPTTSDETHFAAEQLFAQAQVLRRAGKRTEAIEKYNEALKLWQKVDDFRQQGYSFTNIGRCYFGLVKLEPALQNLDQALTLLTKADDLPGQAFVLNELGLAQKDLGDLRKAIVVYDSALKLRIDLEDKYGQAQVYNNRGLAQSLMGSQPQALEDYEKALAIWRELSVRHQEMRTTINAAKAHAELGDLARAQSQYQTVLDFCNAELSTKDSPFTEIAVELKPFALNGLGLVSDTWADSDAALHYYHEALELFRKRNAKEQGDVLDNIGMTYAFLGDPSQAVEYFQQALTVRQLSRQPRPLGMTLSNLGYAYALLQNYEEAQKQLSQALQLTVDTHDRRFEAYTLVRLGMTYVARPAAQPLTALEYYEKALAVQQTSGFEDRRGQAITLDKMAEALAVAGREAEALKKYEDASRLWTAVEDGQGQALSLYGSARIERNRLNLANARDRVEEAIAIVEKLRNKVTARQLQMTYFAGKQDLYALAIDVRMQLYEAKKSPADMEMALAFSEKGRARNFLDLLNEARAEVYRGMSPRDFQQNQQLDQEISILTQNLVRFRGINAKQSVAEIQRKVDDRISKQDLLLAPFKRAAARGQQAQPLSPKEIQQLLDDDMLLLQYSLGEERSHVWAVTRTDIKHYFLTDRKQIEDAAGRLRQALTAKEVQRQDESGIEALNRRRSAMARYRESADHLSRLILSDVGSQLKNKRLVIVADGGLHYIPFEVLPFPDSVVPTQHASATSQRPLLLASNEIIYEPSASALASLRRTRRPVASKKVAVIADPVFSNDDANGSSGKTESRPIQIERAKFNRALRDVGDTASGAGPLQRLEYTLKEADAITKVAPPGSIQAVRFKANRALATGPQLKRFGFLHFATHGVLNEKNPELSGIVLSMFNERGQPENGFLTLRDIYNLDLPAHLVVVSACETGIGVTVRGEGLIGLTRGFMNAGAQSVVVSLWRVEDEATSELMKRFYTHMFGKKKLSPAAALRQAKMEMKDDYYPYQWAGFVLQGDWK